MNCFRRRFWKTDERDEALAGFEDAPGPTKLFIGHLPVGTWLGKIVQIELVFICTVVITVGKIHVLAVHYAA